MKRLWEMAAGCLAALGLVLGAASIARGDDADTDFYFAGHPFFRPCPCPCPCPNPNVAPGTTAPGATPQGGVSPGQPAPGAAAAQPGAAPSAENAPSNDLLAQQGAGVPGGPASGAPNMIGDSNAGGCGAVRFMGVQTLTVQHPTFACDRMNISENNQAEVQDRVYFTYRHYQGTSLLDIFGDLPFKLPPGQTISGPPLVQLFNIDQYTFAFEKKLGNDTSIEVRAPVNTQMPNDLSFSDNLVGTTHEFSIPTSAETTFGNLNVIAKHVLYRSNTFRLSGGVGVNLPTAPPVHIHGLINDSSFPVYNPTTGAFLANVNANNFTFDGNVNNDTVNLQPFFAATWTPNEKWFSNWFVQADVPLNPTGANVQESGFVDGVSAANQESGHLDEQTLLRVNGSLGRWLYRDETARFLNGIACVFEAHYTTTTTDADLLTFQAVPPIATFKATDFTLGNGKGRMDVINGVLGVPIEMGKTSVYNGFVVPITYGNNRGFSFEYVFTIDRHF
jgi:hypothetical protein